MRHSKGTGLGFLAFLTCFATRRQQDLSGLRHNAAFDARNPDGSLANHSRLLNFTAKVTDPGGTPIPASITWSSDMDGALGTSETISRSLTGGPCGITQHRISATAVDGAGRTATDFLFVNVGQIC